jgi:hypothetical protein
MGEAKRRMEMGLMPQIPQQKQIQIDLKNAVPVICECGSQYFQQAALAYKVSALLSPTGQDMLAMNHVFVCIQCRKPVSTGNEKDKEQA